MIYLKLFESWARMPIRDKIVSICNQYGIENYHINSDNTIDVMGDVKLSGNIWQDKNIIKFNRVHGNFDCSRCNLSQLEGCPKLVGGDFNCSHNFLTTLRGVPEKIPGSFFCNNNKLENLEYCPKKIGRDFSCAANSITSLEGCPEEFSGYFNCISNKLTRLDGGPKSVGGYYAFGENNVTFISRLPDIGDRFYSNENPIFNLFKVFNWDYKKFKSSFDLGYLRPENIIIKQRFQEACEEAGIKIPEYIKGYKIISY